MKNTNKRKVDESTENQNESASAAPVAATEASSSAPLESSDESPIKDDVSTEATAEAPSAEGETSESVKGDISVAGSKKPVKEKKPSFEPNVAERTRLYGMTNEQLRTEAGDRVSTVGANDHRVFQADDAKGFADQLVGSPLERSGIRAGVIAFLQTRTGENAVTTKDSTFENAAPGWAIASYMVLATAGGVIKGKFDQGYLAARGNDVRRGMVARKQLRIVADLTPAPVEAPKEEAPAPSAE